MLRCWIASQYDPYLLVWSILRSNPYVFIEVILIRSLGEEPLEVTMLLSESVSQSMEHSFFVGQLVVSGQNKSVVMDRVHLVKKNYISENQVHGKSFSS